MSTTKKKTAPKAAPEPKPAAEAPAATPIAVVYCGPTIKNGPHQFTVYNNGLPNDVKAIIGRYPITANLIVPLDEFAKTKNELKNPDSPAGMVYRTLTNNLKGGKV